MLHNYERERGDGFRLKSSSGAGVNVPLPYIIHQLLGKELPSRRRRTFILPSPDRLCTAVPGEQADAREERRDVSSPAAV